MPCRHFQTTLVALWTFALIFCAWITACRWIEKSKIAFSVLTDKLIDWPRIIISLIDLVICRLGVDHWHPTAPRHFNAQQSCCCSSYLRLPLPSQADLIQINLLIIRLLLRYPRSKLPAATARRTCSDRAPAHKRTVANCSDHAPARKRTLASKWALDFTKIRADTCKYVHILTVRM